MTTIAKLTAATLAATVLGAGTARADTTWAWSYTGEGFSASGTFTTAGNATERESILSISGQRNGVPITRLVPLNDPLAPTRFSWDNRFINAFPYFTYEGLLFDLGTGGVDGYVNVFGNPVAGGGFGTFEYGFAVGYGFAPITFTVAPVPEAATLGCMVIGLAALGTAMQGRRCFA